jgi:hypothetical protein
MEKDRRPKTEDLRPKKKNKPLCANRERDYFDFNPAEIIVNYVNISIFGLRSSDF